MFSLLLTSLLTLSSCNTIVYERIGVMSYWRPQLWLNDTEEKALNDLMAQKDRCIDKVYVKRKVNHITVIWKK